MPSYSSKLELSPAGVSGSIILMEVDPIRGAFKSYPSASTMNSTSPNYFSTGQIVYAEDSGSLFKATVIPADPPNSFTDVVTFAPFSFNSGSFVSASFDGIHTLTLFGENLSGSSRVSMSVDLSELTGSGGGGGGSGDITAVFAGDGLTGGASSGNATLEVDAGQGISLVGGVTVDTGSAHFTQGVQKTNLDGGEV
jgi:hypothetical protein